MRNWGVEHRRQEFTEFYTSSRDDCLRIVAGLGLIKDGAALACHTPHVGGRTR